MRRTTVVRTLVITLVTGLTAAGCSGDQEPIYRSDAGSGPLAVVRQTLQATEAAKTGRLVQQARVPLRDGTVGVVTTEGSYDLATSRSDLRVSVSSDGATPAPLVPSFQVVRDGAAYYYTLPGNPQFAGKWIRKDAAGLAAEMNASGIEADPDDPAPVPLFALLRKVTEPVTPLGTWEGYSGHKVTVPAKDAAAFLGPYVLRLMKEAGVDPADLTGDVSLELLSGPDKKLQRARLTLTPLLEQVAAKTGDFSLKVLAESAVLQIDLQLGELGGPVSIPVPKPHELLTGTR